MPITFFTVCYDKYFEKHSYLLYNTFILEFEFSDVQGIVCNKSIIYVQIPSCLKINLVDKIGAKNLERKMSLEVSLKIKPYVVKI